MVRIPGNRLHEHSVPFWRDEDLFVIDSPITMMLGPGKDALGLFPGEKPLLNTVLRDLQSNRLATLVFNPNKPGQFSILAGNFAVGGNITTNSNGVARMWLFPGGIRFASTRDRQWGRRSGLRIQHQGVHVFSPEQHGQFEHNNAKIQAGYDAQMLLRAKQQVDARAATTQATPQAGNENESLLLEALQHYVDVEFEQEEQLAASTPPYAFTAARPEPRQSHYKQFFRMTINPADYDRLSDAKPGYLRLGNPGQDGFSVEIVNLSAGDTDIIVATDRQIAAGRIRGSGNLYAEANPTLKNVRSDVIEDLRQQASPNPWLLPLAADSLLHSDVKPAVVPIPPSAFPPNPAQVKAINTGAGSNDYTLVLGPPGTGKTTVILQWVRHFVSQGKRVLITSQNNKAVDNVLERLARENGVECVRLGNETKTSSAVAELLIDRAANGLQTRICQRVSAMMDNIRQLQDAIDSTDMLMQEVSAWWQSTGTQQLLNTRRAHRQEHDALESQTDAKRIEFSRATKTLREAQQAMEAARKRFDILRGWSVINPLKWILQPLAASRRRRLQRQLDKAETVHQELCAALDELTQQTDSLMSLLAQLEQRIDGPMDDFRKRVPRQPEGLPPELALPAIAIDDIDAFPGLRFTFAAMRHRCASVLTTMAEWNTSLEQSRQRSLYAFLLQMVDVVGATCIGINTNEDFREIPFDVVIVDESGQIQLHNVMVPLSRAGKAILVGDHKQLPPIVQDELRSELEQRMVRTDLMEKSWFEHLWDRAPADRKIMLDTQFRCPATISDFISAQFYDGLYHAGKGMRDKQPLPGLANSTLCLIDTSGLPISKRQEQSASGNRFCGNRTETELVVNVLVQALQANPWLAERNEIGIIVPLAAHVAEIRRAIRQRARTEPLLADLTVPLTELVASVDSFQGQERELVIMAFGRSNPRAGVGFLADWRRLNVGMTRAKRQLVLIGDMSTLAGRPMKPRDGYSRDAAFKGAMKALVAHVRSVGDYQPAKHWLAEGGRT